MKTQNELYEQLRKRVYEIIYPEGIPLEVGCEVDIEYYKPNIVVEISDEKISVVELGGKLLGYTSFKKDDIAKNLSKPLSLQDLLRAIDPYDIIGMYMVRDNWENAGRLKVMAFLNGVDDEIYINITLPLSAQEPEVLEKLINLLK